MQYLIWVGNEMWVGGVDAPDRDYVRDVVLPALRPLTDDAYVNGPLYILSTLAKSSYVLHGDSVLWCTEWDPGLLVVRFSVDGTFAFSQRRSPVPGFGGRPAPPGEWDAYDEDAPNPLYNLVFDPWDAQFDGEHIARGYTLAGEDVRARWTAAMAHSVELAEQLQAELEAEPEAEERWGERCKQSPLWKGEAP